MSHSTGSSSHPPVAPTTATHWRLPNRELQLVQRPLLMGIVNVTPDSFSDGGRYASAEKAIRHALRLIDDGADIIDIGGESTRPYATPVEEAEESARVLPVVQALAEQTTVPISIDTSKSAVARQAIGRGADIINDVTGLTGDPQMVDVARESRAGICVMHMKGTPQTMQDDPVYDDVVADISRYLAARRDALVAAGIERERICLDPGIGFGKTHQHNLRLMAAAHQFHALGCPLLLGPSRKGFLGKLLGDSERDRTAATIGAALSLAAQGVQIIRVHDVGPVRDALSVYLQTGDGRHR